VNNVTIKQKVKEVVI